jgi:hypothetical protein
MLDQVRRIGALWCCPKNVFALFLFLIPFLHHMSQLGNIHASFFGTLSTCENLPRRLLRFVVECSLPDAECRRVAASRLADIDAVLEDGLRVLPAGRDLPFGLTMSPRVRSSFDSV